MKREKFYLEEYLLGAALLVMLVVAFANVLCRYLFKFSIAFTEELVVYLFLYVTMLGAPAAYSRGANMGFSMLTDRLPQPYQKWVVLVTSVASTAFFLILFYYGWDRAYTQFRYGIVTPIMNIPEWIFSACIPLGSALYIYRCVRFTWKTFLHGPEKEGEE